MQGMTRRMAMAGLLLLAACGKPGSAPDPTPQPAGAVEVMRLISDYAQHYEVPEELLHRMVQRESGYNPGARNGPYYGLLQNHPQTARTMGFRGEPHQLLDAETNLRYAGKYLRGAWLVARGDHDRAEMWYAKGYYYEAKRMGLLEETGLR